MSALRESPTKYVEWQITDFYNIPKKKNYFLESPYFSLSGAVWYLSIYPNGDSEFNTSYGCVGLFLHKRDSAQKYRVFYRLGIKETDGGELEYCEAECTFRKKEWGNGEPNLLKRFKLHKTENVIASDGSLTVFCNIRILNGPFILPAKASQTLSSTAETLEPATQTPLPDTTLAAESETSSQAATLEAASQTSSLYSEGTSLQFPSDRTMTLLEDFKNIYNSRLYTDVTFAVKGETFSVHRSVLATRSPVFACMFKHDMAEKSSGIVEISDCDPDSFDQFLLFLYTGKIDDVTTFKAVHLYATADKYDVKELKEECVRCMVLGVSIDSFCDVIHLAVIHNDSDLLEAATDFFINNLESILPTIKWQELLTEHPLLCNELLIKGVGNRMSKK